VGTRRTQFSFLNRVDQPFWQRIREELERWYADYSDDEHGFGLRRRVRDPAAAQHFGAWWELYLHRLFRCLSFRADVEPKVVGGRPDFRMTCNSDSFLVEATTSFLGIVDEERHPEREAAILAAIDKAQNPNFFVRAEFEKVGDEQPKVREIVEPLERWLESLDPDDVLQRGYFDAPQLLLPVRLGVAVHCVCYPPRSQRQVRPSFAGNAAWDDGVRQRPRQASGGARGEEASTSPRSP
jgi:hypothetical protein